MTTITCKILETADVELEAVARKRGVTKSKVVREAIENVLQSERQRGQLSAHDVMKDACGVIKGGPRDRSWNPKRLEGFGRD